MNFKIERFKCFDSAIIPINNLTVLCGANAAGKSSVIQALLLYRSAINVSLKRSVTISSQLGISLGNPENIIHQSNTSVSESFNLSLTLLEPTDTDILELGLSNDESINSSRFLYVKKKPKRSSLRWRKPFSFTYLSAERNGPRLSQERFSDELSLENSIGVRGEFTAEVLLNNARQKIRSELVFKFREKLRGADAFLLQAVQDWMSTIVGPIEIQALSNNDAPPSINFKRPGIYAEWVTATNTGFGISYTLPIVVAGLLAPKRGIIIVDSPEAHLHPAAQTALAKFLSWVAASDVNVIIETHSDHIIDGFRLSTVTPKLGLRAEKCSIVNIGRDAQDKVEIKSLSIEKDGGLSEWPNGFFDQQIVNARNIAIASREEHARKLSIHS